ncbi:MAG TPA: DUF169 domain-containing protein [Candidatus Margulisiibacteriota bacterium]|nr:DUF169 domain-containing protein [Candidatus Margulisiibacteriota bacterium]
MEKKEWQDYALILKELLQLEYSPVAISILSRVFLKEDGRKQRICRALLDAGKGARIEIDKANNSCFGAAWHLGFHKIQDPKVSGMVKKFVVEGEKLFSSYPALDNLLSQMDEPPDNSSSSFLLSPLEAAESKPQLVIFIVNAEQACRLLTLLTFTDGTMPKIKIGGPTCRMSIIYPLATKEANISFYDYTARKICAVEKDKLLLSIPYPRMPKIMEAIEKCSAGKAKIEFPQEFREFLQKRLGDKEK